MKHYKLAIFDFDGTIADTSPGIYECHRYTNLKMRGIRISDDELSGIIGGPLLKTYIHRFGYTEETAEEAVRIYREHYITEGVKGTRLYPGMTDMLKALRDNGILTAVATLKAENLAKLILNELNAEHLFDLVHGVDEKDTLTKTDLLNMCIKELGCSPSDTLLIGDSEHDAVGAVKSGVDFLAVTYGFGFKPAAKIDYPHIAVCDSANEVKKFFLSD